MTFYRFCGQHFEHDAHVIHQGARNIAGAGNYYCIGWTYSNAFDEVREVS
jgi:hypothetical protein